jgi:hypothetical protein
MSGGKLIEARVRDEDTLGLAGPRSDFVAALQGVFGAMLTRLEDALFELAQVNKSEFERGICFDSIRELRLGRDAINRRFVDAIHGCWQALERGEGPLTRQLGGNDLDEAVALTAAVRQAETACADALRAIRSSLALIVGVPDGDEVIGPRQVFAAFEAAFRDTLGEPSVRRTLLMLFERHVGAALPGLYRDLSVALDRPPPAPKASATTPGGDLPALDALINDAGQRGDLDISALIQQALAAGGDGSGSEATKLLATMQQHDQPGSRSRSASIDLARFATRPVDPGTGDLAQQIVLDMVALLFDGVFNDSAVPVSARLCIARLQIPFLRLALRDRAILARRSHLGRRFFDQLIAVTRGWQEPLLPQQRQVLEALVDRVGEACMDDHRAFAIAAETGLVDLRTLALPAAESTHPNSAQRRSLTARVEAELNERRQQAGRVPDPINAFLGTHWMQYLVNCLESHGPEASPWRQGLATVDALLWSVSPKEGAARQRLMELRPRMMRRLRQGMDEVGVSMFEQEAFLETLETILDRAQAGEPVWDWDQESAIDELLGANESPPLPSDAVSVVELDKPVAPVRLVVPRPPRAAVEAPTETDDVNLDVVPAEETISIEELAEELSQEDIAPLDLPIKADAFAEPVPVFDAQVVTAAVLAEEFDADAVMVEPYAVGVAGVDEMVSESVEAGETIKMIDTVNVVESSATDAVDVEDASEVAEVAGVEPAVDEPVAVEAPPVNSLQALMRRRGLSTVTQVEEVEVTDRVGRG